MNSTFSTTEKRKYSRCTVCYCYNGWEDYRLFRFKDFDIRQREIQGWTPRQRPSEAEGQRNSETEGQTDRDLARQRDRGTERQRDKETDRQRPSEAKGQRDRKTDT